MLPGLLQPAALFAVDQLVCHVRRGRLRPSVQGDRQAPVRRVRPSRGQLSHRHENALRLPLHGIARRATRPITARELAHWPLACRQLCDLPTSSNKRNLVSGRVNAGTREISRISWLEILCQRYRHATAENGRAVTKGRVQALLFTLKSLIKFKQKVQLCSSPQLALAALATADACDYRVVFAQS